MHTWSLLAVLYSAIEAASAVHLLDKPTLVDMKRRANLSKWLQVILGRHTITAGPLLLFPCLLVLPIRCLSCHVVAL